MTRRGVPTVPSGSRRDITGGTPGGSRRGGRHAPDRLAARLAAELRPATALVVGSGDEPLVAALRRQGVAAQLVDGRELASAAGGPVARYDLVLCLDALEHLPVDEVDTALARLCGHGDDIIFSCRTEAYDDPGCRTVQPLEQWVQGFARHGFLRDVDFDALSLGPSALRLRRSRDSLERMVASYERALGRLIRENRARASLVSSQEMRLSALEEELARFRGTAPEGPERALRDEVKRLAAELNRAERGLMEADRTCTRLQGELASVRDTATYRLADRIHRGMRRALPYESRRGALLASGVRGALLLSEQGPGALMHRARTKLARPAPAVVVVDAPAPAAAPSSSFNVQYQTWLRARMPDEIELELMRAESETWSHRPLVSIVMPVYNTPLDVLTEAIASAKLQSYTNWELCIADDASTDPDVHRALRDNAACDGRIRLNFCSEHRGIVGTSNAALEMATGELVAFLDHDDVLRRHALHLVVELLQEHRDAGVIYSDEDKLLLSDELGDPFFKPHWSPDLLLSSNYLCHLTVLRRDLVTEVGGFRAGFDGSQDHDLFLRVTELAEQRGLTVTHLPEMLYTWRQMPGSAALSTEAKPDAYIAGQRAVEEALDRRGLDARVTPGAHPGWYHVRYAIRGRPTVTIVIPTRDRLELLSACVESIERLTTYADHSVLIVDNDSRDPATLEYLASTPHRVLRDPGHFNYSRIMNDAIAQVAADHVVLLNNDITVITPDWLEALLEHSQRPEVGAVGCRLLYPDGRPQHEGIAVGVGCPAINLDLSAMPPLGLAIREVTAVTGACMMMRRAVYQEMGGLEEELRVAYNDVDLCLRLRRAGHRVMYTPLAQLYHHESASRRSLHPVEDDVRFAARWGHHRQVRDAFVNPHLAWLSPPVLRLS